MVDGGRREDRKKHEEAALQRRASSEESAPMQGGRTADVGGNVFRVWLNFTERWMGRV